ncbi:hypothetical protein PMIN04_004562 [Paraphaeosphaeria minitans]
MDTLRPDGAVKIGRTSILLLRRQNSGSWSKTSAVTSYWANQQFETIVFSSLSRGYLWQFPWVVIQRTFKLTVAASLLEMFQLNRHVSLSIV